MFKGFESFQIQTSDPEVQIVGKHGGSGPPLLLIHGNPLSHMSWAGVAEQLAENFTVVAADIRGYGHSSKPKGLPDHSNYTFRRMAQDHVEVMNHFGFKKFAVAGHDRGARVAHRMCLDHDEAISKAAFLDILPTEFVWRELGDLDVGLSLYHWTFLSQPPGFPEALLKNNEPLYIRSKLMSQGLGKGGFTKEQIAYYTDLCTPDNIHAVCEDYRASATLDIKMDSEDRLAGRKVKCPVMLLWGESSHTARHEGGPSKIWEAYANNIAHAEALPCGHYPLEQAPGPTLKAMVAFFLD
ncbi:MAG: alpha/beta hydrolase [Pusillimonas sp.]